ncbi:MAG: hypothetical protein HY897_08415 [Deltaproteobacteria bacterium]|nr:hypothetical protein [Deltaproteobacteria bacterium]
MQKCAMCEHEQEAGEECENCGKAFPQTGPTAGAAVPAADSDDDLLLMPGATVANPALTCPHCQQPTAEIFCPNCGIRVRPHGFKTPAQPVEAPAAAPRAYTCPHCQQPTTEMFCPTCAIRVRSGGAEKSAMPQLAGALRAYACPHCQQPTTELFCPACGVRVRPRPPEPQPATGAEPERRACPSCGQWTEATTCPRCGVRMTSSAL